jgi:hypothetical protein
LIEPAPEAALASFGFASALLYYRPHPVGDEMATAAQAQPSPIKPYEYTLPKELFHALITQDCEAKQYRATVVSSLLPITFLHSSTMIP